MEYKTKVESTELKILKYLNRRVDLSEKERQHSFNLQKGHEGEVMFNSMTKELQCECLVLNDLLLKVNNTTFQIDSLIIVSNTVYLFEVKNYEGDYNYESDTLKIANLEISNPLIQLDRTESLLRQLLQRLKIDIAIDASIIFINPEFTLYQSPRDKPFIFPSQVNRLLKKINSIPSKLLKKHKNLAEKLVSLHITDNPFAQVPSFHYEQLRKGIICMACESFLVFVIGRKCVCQDCGCEEVVADTVMRSVGEFKLLFPNKKVTTNAIHDWCKSVISKKRIQRILEKNMKTAGIKRWTYYI